MFDDSTSTMFEVAGLLKAGLCPQIWPGRYPHDGQRAKFFIPSTYGADWITIETKIESNAASTRN